MSFSIWPMTFRHQRRMAFELMPGGMDFASTRCVASGRKDAVVYCNRATIPEVRVGTGTQVLGVDYFLWVATLDGTLVTPGPVHLAAPPYTYPGVVACQIRGAGLTGGDWDQSLVFESKIWVSLPPVPVPVPVPRVSRAQAETAVAGILKNLAVLTKAAGQLPA